MSFLIKDNELLGYIMKFWDKFSNTIKKGSDSEPMYNKENI